MVSIRVCMEVWKYSYKFLVVVASRRLEIRIRLGRGAKGEFSLSVKVYFS